MGRTLTASKAEPASSSRALPDSLTDEVRACIFSALVDLFYLGRKRAAVVQSIAERDSWANRAYAWLVRHEDHPDIASRRQRLADAEQRLLELRGERNAIDGEAESLRRNLAKNLDRLKPKRRAELLAQDGWPVASTSEGVAEKLWREAQEWKPMPQGEAPF